MYPQRELIRLRVHKAALRRKITRDRARCVAAAARVAQPLEWVDRALVFWRRISPVTMIAALPLGWLIKRTGSPRLKLLGSIVKWGPMIAGAVRGVSAALKSRVPSTKF